MQGPVACMKQHHEVISQPRTKTTQLALVMVRSASHRLEIGLSSTASIKPKKETARWPR